MSERDAEICINVVRDWHIAGYSLLARPWLLICTCIVHCLLPSNAEAIQAILEVRTWLCLSVLVVAAVMQAWVVAELNVVYEQ
jgi:hypothetical protein